MFAGQCTTPGFYTPENFERGFKASAVLAALIHGDPDFSSKFSLYFARHAAHYAPAVYSVRLSNCVQRGMLILSQLQAINEPDQDPSQTPNLDICRSHPLALRSAHNLA